MTITQILQKIRSAFYTKAETDTKINTALNTKANDNDVVHKNGDETINGIKIFTSETVNHSVHAFRHVFGDYGVFWRHDNVNLYLMLTNSGDQYGGWNDFRPLTVNLATGTCNISGTAGGVAWTNVSDRPTKVSQFTNDSGYITTDGAAYPRRVGGVTMNFNWSGQGGQPSWLWGGEDGVNMYVYNPSNFSVNYANSAGSATYASWLRASSHSDHLFHTDWDGSFFWTYVTAPDGGYRAVRVARSDSAAYAERSMNNGAFYISGYQIYVG